MKLIGIRMLCACLLPAAAAASTTTFNLMLFNGFYFTACITFSRFSHITTHIAIAGLQKQEKLNKTVICILQLAEFCFNAVLLQLYDRLIADLNLAKNIYKKIKCICVSISLLCVCVCVSVCD